MSGVLFSLCNIKALWMLGKSPVSNSTSTTTPTALTMMPLFLDSNIVVFNTHSLIRFFFGNAKVNILEKHQPEYYSVVCHSISTDYFGFVFIL
jgi:hypothetical protein